MIASTIGLFFTYLDDYKVLIGFVWLELFFGAAIVPTLQGLMISSIPTELRALGNSFAQLVMNLLGNLPAPLLYGYVQSLAQGMA